MAWPTWASAPSGWDPNIPGQQANSPAQFGGFDPNKVAQVGAAAAARPVNPANTWGNTYGNILNQPGSSGNLSNFYNAAGLNSSGASLNPNAPFNPMTGAAPGVSLGQVASGNAGGSAFGTGGSGTGYETVGPEPAGYGGSGNTWLGGVSGGPNAAANNAAAASAPYMATAGVATPASAPAPMSASSPTAQSILGQGWNPSTGYGPGTGPGSSSTSFGVPPQIAQYLDPSMAFQQAQGLRALQSSAAAQGNLLSGNTLKDITNYSQGLASTGYNNAFNQAAQQQGFGAGLQQQDWLNNLMLANQLTGQGQYGTTGTANTNNLLATLLSQNALAAGNVNAGGTIGGANAITGGLQQAIANMLAQNLYNRIPALNPQG